MRVEPGGAVINLDRLDEYPLVGIDVETTGTKWKTDRIFGVAIAAQRPNGKIESVYHDVREKPRILELLRDKLHKCKRVVNHSIKFDAHMLLNEDIRIAPEAMECVMVRAALIDEHRLQYSLDSLAKDILGEGKDDTIWQTMADAFGGKATRSAQILNLARAPSSLAAKYATPDPALALKLWLWQEKEIEKQGLQKVWHLERALTPILLDIERGGVRVDVDLAVQRRDELARAVAQKRRALEAGTRAGFNASSPPQVKALFDPKQDEDGNWHVGVPGMYVYLEKTDTGGPSIGKDALQEIATRLKDPRAQMIIDVRKYAKAQEFFDGHILGNQIRGYVYPNYNQTKDDRGLGTGTGRFSIDDPALQQIPKRDKDIAALVRGCFLPDKGDDWGCADWEQFEFRWFAHYVKDEEILRRYNENPATDYHAVVSEITGIPRNPRHAGDPNAKQINLGLVFGMGQGKLAQEMGLPYTTIVRRNKEVLIPGEEAITVFEKYHGAIPGVKALLERAGSIARSRGYVGTAMGRHIRFPNGQFTHKAGGLVFQGTSADCMKQKLIELHPISKKEGFRLLLSVHDEVDFSTPKRKGKKHAALVKHHLEIFDGERCPIKCRVPILSDVKLGPNWWEACK